MKKILVVCMSLIGLHQGFCQETQIRSVIEKMFQSMYKRDTVSLRMCFMPEANLRTYSYDSRGNPKANELQLNEFLKEIAMMEEADMEERLTGWQCLVDEGIASVWTPYEFYFENDFSHCGVNSFQLMQVEKEWKITMITDTRRKTPCPSDQETVAGIDSLINLWHHAAAIADEDAFFGRMTAESIYIGTDASERWLRDELKEWSKKYFDRESAWAFTTMSRNVRIGPGEQIAWFDELLDTWMGICRSTGIMMKEEGEWKIIYYHLSVALPNEKLDGYRILIGKS